ncbi:hypothetical protein [Aquitalea magnusonii]|uniref:hypothetical protein n=1 Tax=Aquitalea magnusonii TaxID=332411 RepID=UPI0011B6B766|nr:hypothetical protein [Aquitalea magnusonii]
MKIFSGIAFAIAVLLLISGYVKGLLFIVLGVALIFYPKLIGGRKGKEKNIQVLDGLNRAEWQENMDISHAELKKSKSANHSSYEKSAVAWILEKFHEERIARIKMILKNYDFLLAKYGDASSKAAVDILEHLNLPKVDGKNLSSILYEGYFIATENDIPADMVEQMTVRCKEKAEMIMSKTLDVYEKNS